MAWLVEFQRDFKEDFDRLSDPVQDEILALAEKMRVIGSNMKRPASDTLAGSAFKNMRELRFQRG